MESSEFKLESAYSPTGDQPVAIELLADGVSAGKRFQTLEGVTGSGKTFSIANVIKSQSKPVLVISHNKTLAAQLYSELKSFFPDNAVEYFISYYDYYQPEAYIPGTDTYIEKDSSINEEIERLRLAATDSLLNRRDVIIVASVSCIYGLGSPEDYKRMVVRAHRGEDTGREQVMQRLVDVQYERNDYEYSPGSFRVRGDILDVFPSYSKQGIRIDFFGDQIDRICRIDPLTGNMLAELDRVFISPAKHFVMPHERIEEALTAIEDELDEQIALLENHNKLVEAQRLKMRTMYDLEMMEELGYCSGIENYSRHLAGRAPGERPDTLMDYFQDEFLTVIDESHVTLPQIRGMYNGDQARKRTLVEHGFRLPSALDNRPLNFEEFLSTAGQIIFTSATPGNFEREVSGGTIKQIIRPTGILDPEIEVRPLEGQIDDLIEEVRKTAEADERTLVTTLTKRTSEDLAEYLENVGLRVKYLHSDIDSIERVEIIRGLRKSEFDCLIGINLLREGLDLPEVSLVAVLDADKEGFLRSETSLIQTAGRAARHIRGRVIMYADATTNSMRRTIETTNERRKLQSAYNKEHGVEPQAIRKDVYESMRTVEEAVAVETRVVKEAGLSYSGLEQIRRLEKEMLDAADSLDFERAAIIRDKIEELDSNALSKCREP